MIAQPMNRAQRRAAAKQKARRVSPHAAQRAMSHLLKPLKLLNDCRPYEAGELTTDLIKLRTIFDRLKSGEAEDDEFNKLAVVINMARIRASDIDPKLEAIVEQGQEAMKRCQQRRIDHGRYGFDGLGLIAMAKTMNVHEAIIQKSTPKQMSDALWTLRRIYERMQFSSGAVGLMKQGRTDGLGVLA